MAKALLRSSLLPASFRPFHPSSLSPSLSCSLPPSFRYSLSPLPPSLSPSLLSCFPWYLVRTGTPAEVLLVLKYKRYQVTPLELQFRLEANYLKCEGFVHKTGPLCYEQ